jgi:hypothetical protein
MSVIKWDELPEARQQLSRASQERLQSMLFCYFNSRNAACTCRHFGISRAPAATRLPINAFSETGCRAGFTLTCG